MARSAPAYSALCRSLWNRCRLFIQQVTSRPGLFLCLCLAAVARYSDGPAVHAVAKSTAIFCMLLLVLFLLMPAFFIEYSRKKDMHVAPPEQPGRTKRTLSWFYRVLFIALPLYTWLSFASSAENHRLADHLTGRTEIVTGRILTHVPIHSDQDGAKWCNVAMKTDCGLVIQLSGPADKLRYNSIIRTEVEFEKPTEARNPGGFSQIDYLRSRGILLAGKTLPGGSIEPVNPGYTRWQPAVWSADVRRFFAQTSLRYLKPEQNHLLGALLFGDNDRIEPADRIRIRRAGLGHLTAVSGAHVSFILVPVSAFIHGFSRGRSQSFILQTVLLCLYGFITGWQIGAARAILMTSLMILARCFNRMPDGMNNLGIAASAMILINRSVVWQTGFWLSFCAAAALMLLSSPLTVWICKVAARILRTGPVWRVPIPEHRLQRFCQALAAVWLMQVLLAPLSVHLTGELNLLSWLINLPGIFLVSLIFIFAMPLLPVLAFLQYLTFHQEWLPFKFLEELFALLFRILVGVPLMLLQKLIRIASDLLILRIPAQQINLLYWLGSGLLVLWIWCTFVVPAQFDKRYPVCSCRALAARQATGKAYAQQNTLLFKVSVMFIVLAVLISCIQYKNRPEWRIFFLDVGQGDAALLLHRNGQSVLVDGGPAGSGYYVIVPAMISLGIRRVDLAIMTHGHDDHLSGLLEISELGLVRNLALPWETDHENDDFGRQSDARNAELLRYAQDHRIPVRYLKKHDTISLAGRAIIDVMLPDPDFQPRSAAYDVNDACMIMVFTADDFTMLLLADLTDRMEKYLDGQWPDADLIKVAHHGSGATTKEPFVRQTRPEHAVVSVGRNFYGHPARDVIERLENVGTVWRTDQSGCVQCNLHAGKYQVSAFHTGD